MRGLSDNERAWLSADGQIVPGFSGADAVALVERGLVDFTDEQTLRETGRPFIVTRLTALALRVDAAARVAGVWPR